MKKTVFLLAAALVVLGLASCSKTAPKPRTSEGTLSFADFDVRFDDELLTKAPVAAPGNYIISVTDEVGTEVFHSTYSQVLGSGSQVSLPAGDYTLKACSLDGDIPAAAFEQPVYGASAPFSISAGETTTIGTLTCTLVQVKATVSYDDAFLNTVTGNGKTTLTVDPSSPLEYELNYNGGNPTYNQNAGYFTVVSGTNASMNIVFSGSISGKSQKMVANLTGLEVRQWRQIRFVKKTDEAGNATFAIEINSYIEDEELVVPLEVEPEHVIGEDLDAPKGDGGITLEFAEGCAYTDLDNIVVPAGASGMDLRLKITVPNGIRKFIVQMASTSDAFLASVALAGGTTLDLINPTEDQDIVFQIVPFPHGSELLGQTELLFDLSNAQEPINAFPGRHTFTMEITDTQGCRNSIPVTLVVNE